MEKLNELMSKACLASEMGKRGITVDLQILSQIRDEFWAVEKRAEAAEAHAAEGWSVAHEVAEECDQLKAKLAELDKQEPIGRVDRGAVSDNNEYPNARVLCLHYQADWENFEDGTELFLHPAPAVRLAELVPDDIRSRLFALPMMNKEEGDELLCDIHAWLTPLILRKIEEAK